MRWNRRASALGACVLAGALGLPWRVAPVAAQSLEGTGAVAVGLLLRQMDGVKRVLMIGAHPDDEDTSLLTTLARGWGAETAYLSLTRGDGGQNVIGPELWEGLGVVRTGELDAARRLDGGLQFFTRAFDYGFSKSADEALTFWPREELLEDVVWVIRRFRPHVVVSVWSGTSRDGHGQHQASGIIAREAFDVAGDASRFPEQLERGVEPWAPDKYYVSDRFGGRGGGPPAGALSVPTGTLDPLLGRSLFQLSMESRSQHRSQEMGAPQTLGPRETGVALVASRVSGGEAGIFAGIDTTLAGLTEGLPDIDPTRARAEISTFRAAARIRDYRNAVSRARSDFGLDPSRTVDALAEALTNVRAALEDLGAVADYELRSVLERREALATRALAAAAGITLDVRAEDDLIVPGQTVRVTAQLWSGGEMTLGTPELRLDAPAGWSVERTGVTGLTGGDVAPGTLTTWTYDVTVPADAEPSRLYYLWSAREGAMYAWPDDPALHGLSRDPVPVTGSVDFLAQLTDRSVAARVEISTGWRYVGVDPTRGELTRRVLVVPAVSVRVAPAGVVWPQSSGEARTLSVVVHNEADGISRGEVAVRAPSGWTVMPRTQPFTLEEAGAERSLTFTVSPTGAPLPGRHVFDVVARTGEGHEYREGYALIDYDHIERAALFEPAEARVSVVPVLVAEGVRVGYVMGSGDDGPDALRQLGVPVEILEEGRVRAGDFGDFTTIVLGVRAEETRPDLRAASGQLLDFVRGGGVVIAQYNRGPLGSVAPLPVEVDRGAPRVADETAPVRVLDPDAPVFATPNRIVQADFDGWVQERGLYFASEWDDAYVPLLEMNDPGESPARGSLLVGSAGEGVFVYAALSFFRQWSEGVPGAYRLFANLISLDPAAWRAYSTPHRADHDQDHDGADVPQVGDVSGMPKFTKATSDMPAISPKNAPGPARPRDHRQQEDAEDRAVEERSEPVHHLDQGAEVRRVRRHDAREDAPERRRALRHPQVMRRPWPRGAPSGGRSR
jgi:LmbE family N-acetylglucosaminyl deacetylase